MDFLFEFLFELVFEGMMETAKSKKVPMVINNCRSFGISFPFSCDWSYCAGRNIIL